MTKANFAAIEDGDTLIGIYETRDGAAGACQDSYREHGGDGQPSEDFKVLDLRTVSPDAPTLTAYESGVVRAARGLTCPAGATRLARKGHSDAEMKLV